MSLQHVYLKDGVRGGRREEERFLGCVMSLQHVYLKGGVRGEGGRKDFLVA